MAVADVSRCDARHAPAFPQSSLGHWGRLGLVGALLFFSGAIALVHEALWTRRLVDLMGATGQSTSRVLGGFFLGLSMGAALAAVAIPHLRRPLRVAGLAEAAVALLCMPLLTLPYWGDSLWLWLGSAALEGWSGSLLKLGISLALICPPAFAMGAVFPCVMADVLQRHRAKSETGIGLYALNTAGGLCGLLFVSLALLPWVGGGGALVAAAIANLLVGFCLCGIDALQPPLALCVPSSAVPIRGTPRIVSAQWLLAFGSGFLVLAFEVLALRSLMLVAPLSYHTPAVLLSVVLAGLAVAPWATTPLLRHFSAAKVARIVLPAAAVAVATSPLLFMGVARNFSLAPTADFETYVASLAMFAACSFGIPVGMVGLLFPLAVAWNAEPGANSSRWGWLIAVNGLGGWLGTEFASEVLLSWVGLYPGLGVIGLLLTMLALPLADRDATDESSMGKLIPCGTGLLILALTVGPLQSLPLVNPALDLKVIAQRMDREGTVAVVENPGFGRALLVSNQYILGSTRASSEERRQMSLPLVLHPAPKRVACIGIATGITPGAALDDPLVEQLTAMELSPSIVSLAQEHFSTENRGLTENPRVRIIVEDGRTVLAASRQEFDLVVGDLILPWSPGEGRLYTLEHFKAVRRSLRPGGMYCQWLPMYQLTPDQFSGIVRTFLQAFPRAELIRREFGLLSSAVGLIGWESDRVIDWAVVAERCRHARENSAITDPTTHHSELVAMLSLGRADRWTVEGRINTLDDTFIELDAGRERVTGRPGSKYLLGGKWMEYLERGVSLSLGGEDDDCAELRRLGLAWSVAEMELLKQSRQRQQPPDHLPELHLPEALRQSLRATWNEGPGDPRLVRAALQRRP